MALSDEQLAIAIEDARTRHAAVVELVYFIDQQAMTLLGIYLTLGTVTGSGAVAALDPKGLLPPSVGVALLAASTVLVLGATYCFRAMSQATINLPGRDPDFWIWSQKHSNLSFADSVKHYLESLQEKANENRALNRNNANKLASARICGVLVPAVLVLSGGVDYMLRSICV